MIYHGDCLEVMRGMDANSIDAIVTDPPYGLEFMGKEWDRFSGKFSKNEDWDHGNLGGLPRQRHRNIKCQDCGKWIYDHPPHNCTCGGIRRQQMRFFEEFCYSWAVEALRVAKPGAHLLAFGGTRTFHRLACAIEDAGWEIRDCVMWVYGSGFPKSLDVSKAIDKAAVADRYVTSPATAAAQEWQGYGTALKPAYEPIILARKPLAGTVAENVLQYGCGGLNIDGCRVEINEKLPTHRTPGGIHHNVRAYGWDGNRALPPEDRAQPQSCRHAAGGRWPSNLIHDGSEEVVELFPVTTSGSGIKSKEGHSIGMLKGNANWRFTRDGQYCHGDTGSAARFFYCAKASKAERDAGRDALAGKTQSNHHPTVKPIALMRYLCRLITPPGGLVLDPFCGSGSTGIAAGLENFRFVGIEQDEEYCRIAEARIDNAIRQGRLLFEPIMPIETHDR